MKNPVTKREVVESVAHLDNPGSGPPPSAAGASLTLAIIGPFAFGYFLSYLLRNVNAIVAPRLLESFPLDAAAIGLLTSAYFFAFALFQPLLGVLLDRFGPRRVESLLLLVAALGCLIFAWGGAFWLLVAGRTLIGLGVSACLMAAFQANSLWFARGRLASMNAWILVAGGVGVIGSTAPVGWMLKIIDWRHLFTLFAAFFTLGSLLILLLVPQRATPGAKVAMREHFQGLKEVGGSREFWRIAPLTMVSQATFMSIQGLWAAFWMRDVGGYTSEEIGHYLLLAAAAMAAGHLLAGNLATRLMRFGHAPTYAVAAGIGAAVAVQLLLAMGYQGSQTLIWVLFGLLGTAGTVNFALLAQSFPVAMAGRVNTSLNMLIFVCSFLLQWVMGVVINRFPTSTGGYAPEGYALAFGATALLQVLGIIWYLSRLQPRATS